MGQAAKEALITVFNTKEIDRGTLTTAGNSKNGFHVSLGKLMRVFSLWSSSPLSISADRTTGLDKQPLRTHHVRSR